MAYVFMPKRVNLVIHARATPHDMFAVTER